MAHDVLADARPLAEVLRRQRAVLLRSMLDRLAEPEVDLRARAANRIQIVVGEGGILLAVKNFQHCRSRVSAKIIAHLVDFVQKYKRIFASHKLNRIHNSSGHCAYICFSMTANVRFVFHSAQRNSGIFSSHCRRNVFCD